MMKYYVFTPPFRSERRGGSADNQWRTGGTHYTRAIRCGVSSGDRCVCLFRWRRLFREVFVCFLQWSTHAMHSRLFRTLSRSLEDRFALAARRSIERRARRDGLYRRSSSTISCDSVYICIFLLQTSAGCRSSRGAKAKHFAGAQ